MEGRRRRGQISIEFMILISATLIILTTIVVLIQWTSVTHQGLSTIAEARSAVEKLANAVNLVSSQGCPASIMLQVHLPTGTNPSESFIGSRYDVSGDIISLRVVMASGEEDVIARTAVPVNGSLPATAGPHTMIVQNLCSHVTIGEPSLAYSPTSLSIVLFSDLWIEDFTVVNKGDIWLNDLHLSTSSTLEPFLRGSERIELAPGERNRLHATFGKGDTVPGESTGVLFLHADQGIVGTIPTHIIVKNMTRVHADFCNENADICSDPDLGCTDCVELWTRIPHNLTLELEDAPFIPEGGSLRLSASVIDQQALPMPGLVLYLLSLTDQDGTVVEALPRAFTDHLDGRYELDLALPDTVVTGRNYVAEVYASDGTVFLTGSQAFYHVPHDTRLVLTMNATSFASGEEVGITAAPLDATCAVKDGWTFEIEGVTDLASGMPLHGSSCLPRCARTRISHHTDNGPCTDDLDVGDTATFRIEPHLSRCGVNASGSFRKDFFLRAASKAAGGPVVAPCDPCDLEDHTTYSAADVTLDAIAGDNYVATFMFSDDGPVFMVQDTVTVGEPDWDFWITKIPSGEARDRCFLASDTIHIMIDTSLSVNIIDELSIQRTMVTDPCGTELYASAATFSGSGGTYTASLPVSTFDSGTGLYMVSVYLEDGIGDRVNLTWSFELCDSCEEFTRSAGGYSARYVPRDTNRTHMVRVRGRKDGVDLRKEAVITVGIGPENIAKDILVMSGHIWADTSSEFRSPIVINERTGNRREHVPIDMELRFRNGTVTNCTRELRVFHKEVEVPSQVYDEEHFDGFCIQARLAFEASLEPNRTAVYHVYYGNGNEVLPSYETPLTIRDLGATVSMANGDAGFGTTVGGAFHACTDLVTNFCTSTSLRPEPDGGVTIDGVDIISDGPVFSELELTWSVSNGVHTVDRARLYAHGPYLYISRRLWTDAQTSTTFPVIATHMTMDDASIEVWDEDSRALRDLNDCSSPLPLRTSVVRSGDGMNAAGVAVYGVRTIGSASHDAISLCSYDNAPAGTVDTLVGTNATLSLGPGGANYIVLDLIVATGTSVIERLPLTLPNAVDVSLGTIQRQSEVLGQEQGDVAGPFDVLKVTMLVRDLQDIPLDAPRYNVSVLSARSGEGDVLDQGLCSGEIEDGEMSCSIIPGEIGPSVNPVLLDIEAVHGRHALTTTTGLHTHLASASTSLPVNSTVLLYRSGTESAMFSPGDTATVLAQFLTSSGRLPPSMTFRIGSITDDQGDEKGCDMDCPQGVRKCTFSESSNLWMCDMDIGDDPSMVNKSYAALIEGAVDGDVLFRKSVVLGVGTVPSSTPYKITSYASHERGPWEDLDVTSVLRTAAGAYLRGWRLYVEDCALRNVAGSTFALPISICEFVRWGDEYRLILPSSTLADLPSNETYIVRIIANSTTNYTYEVHDTVSFMLLDNARTNFPVDIGLSFDEHVLCSGENPCQLSNLRLQVNDINDTFVTGWNAVANLTEDCGSDLLSYLIPLFPNSQEGSYLYPDPIRLRLLNLRSDPGCTYVISAIATKGSIVVRDTESAINLYHAFPRAVDAVLCAESSDPLHNGTLRLNLTVRSITGDPVQGWERNLVTITDLGNGTEQPVTPPISLIGGQNVDLSIEPGRQYELEGLANHTSGASFGSTLAMLSRPYYASGARMWMDKVDYTNTENATVRLVLSDLGAQDYEGLYDIVIVSLRGSDGHDVDLSSLDTTFVRNGELYEYTLPFEPLALDSMTYIINVEARMRSNLLKTSTSFNIG